MTEQLIRQLLALTSISEQQQVLTAANRWHEDGFAELNAFAMQQMQTAPQAASELLSMLRELARRARFDSAFATASWHLARNHAQLGQFVQANTLLKQAHDAFLALSDTLMAARTQVGRISILAELGQLNEAIALADATLLQFSAEKSTPAKFISALMLQNRGMCYGHSGQYDKALDDYETAAMLFDALGEAARHGDILRNQAVILLFLGRASEAVELLEQSLQRLDAAQMPLLVGQTETNMGHAQMLLGRHSDSIGTLQQAAERLEQGGFASYAAVTRSDLAEAFLTVGDYTRAADHYGQAIAVLNAADMLFHRTRAQFGLGVTQRALLQVDNALESLQAALSSAELIENNALRAAIMVEIAAIFVMKDKLQGARILASNVLMLAEQQSLPTQRCFAAMLLFDLDLADEELQAASANLAQAKASAPKLPHIAYRIAFRDGQLAQALGLIDDAEQHFLQAIGQIEQTRGNLVQESLRVAFMGDKVDLYASLIQLYLNQGRTLEALTTAEQAKSRTLIEMMEGVLDTPSLNENIESALSIREMREALNALYNQLLSDEGDRRVNTSQAVLKQTEQSARSLEKRIRTLLNDVQIADGQLANGLDSSTGHQIEQIPSDTTLIEYHAIGDSIAAFVYSGAALRVQQNLCKLSDVRQLTQRWQVHLRRLRSGGPFVERNRERLHASANTILQALYQALFEPLRSLIEAVEANSVPSLLIVPHGDLFDVPFQALYDGAAYLVDQYAIAYAPSLAVFVTAQARKQLPTVAPKALVIGVSNPSLPAVLAETQMVAQQFESPVLLQDQAATRDAFFAHADSAIVHVATHGIYRADNPSFSGVRLQDGWISAEDIMRMRFNNSLVMLSACESGRSRVSLGDEPIGLPRALLAAGARSTIVTLWLVQDEISAETVPIFYRELLAHQPTHIALRTMQLALKQQHPHPYFWAAHVMFGAF